MAVLLPRGAAPRASWTAADGRAVAHIMLVAVALRVGTALFAFLANAVLPLDRPEQFTVLDRTHLFWDVFARWDSGWYLGLASSGYQYVADGRNNLAFFPVYPLLMGGLGRLLGGSQPDFYFAGIVVSWLASIVAAGVMYALARLDLSPARAWHAALLTLVFPFAFFFGVVYTEGLFLCLLVSTVYALRTRRWLLGAAVGALLTASRVNGVMAVPGLVWLAWQAAGDDPAERRRGVLAALAAGLGIAAYSGFNWWLAGDPFEWYRAITRWDYRPGTFPGEVIWRLWVALATRPYEFLSTEMGPFEALNGFAATTAVLSLPFIWRRFGTGYALIVAANIALPLSSGQFEGLGRYTAVLFPVHFALAAVLPRRLVAPVYAASGAFYAFCCLLFTLVHPLL
jgi:hypothetical protein